jgi:hypothetical protein
LPPVLRVLSVMLRNESKVRRDSEKVTLRYPVLPVGDCYGDLINLTGAHLFFAHDSQPRAGMNYYRPIRWNYTGPKWLIRAKRKLDGTSEAVRNDVE